MSDTFRTMLRLYASAAFVEGRAFERGDSERRDAFRSLKAKLEVELVEKFDKVDQARRDALDRCIDLRSEIGAMYAHRAADEFDAETVRVVLEDA